MAGEARREAGVRCGPSRWAASRGACALGALAHLCALVPGLARAADGATVSVSATVLSKSQCRFNSAIPALSFGSIDPFGGADATATTTATFKCSGSAPDATFVITHDSGLYETAANANRMQNQTAPTEFLSYSLTLSPATATVSKNVTQTLTIEGRVAAAIYQDAQVGDYTDTVTLTITP